MNEKRQYHPKVDTQSHETQLDEMDRSQVKENIENGFLARKEGASSPLGMRDKDIESSEM